MYPRFQLIRTVSLGALLISAAIMPLCEPAKADEGLLDDPGPFGTPEQASIYCHKYAKAAVTAARKNEEHGCYPMSNRWSTNENAHYDFCAWHTTDVSFLEYETAVRKTQAENCRYCNSAEFATTSANRVLDNKLFACNLDKSSSGSEPSEWSDDSRVRYQACLHGGSNGSTIAPSGGALFGLHPTPRLSLMPISSKDQEAYLQKKVDGPQCKKQKQYDQQATSSCEDYATQAMKLASYNNGYHCGFERTSPPGQWSTNWQFHFNWCIWKDNAPFRAGEQNARMTAMKQCMAKHGDTPDPNDLAFTPVRGGGFHSADQISNIEPPTAIPPSFTPSVNGTITTNPIPFPRGETPRVIPRPAQPTGTIGINNRIPYDVFQKPNVPPALGQPANPRTGPNPPRGSSGGGIDTVMNTPPSQPPRMPIPPTGTPSGSPSTPGGNGQAHPSRVPTAKPPTGTVTPTAPPNPRLYPAKPSGTAVATSSGSSSSWRHRITLLRHLRKTKPFTPPLH